MLDMAFGTGGTTFDGVERRRYEALSAFYRRAELWGNMNRPMQSIWKAVGATRG